MFFVVFFEVTLTPKATNKKGIITLILNIAPSDRWVKISMVTVGVATLAYGPLRVIFLPVLGDGPMAPLAADKIKIALMALFIGP